ncbi:MAG: UDP-N-acetylmuramoyl-L-alanine--D-glutamate ligase [Solirubrobacteraceae bacterium]
MRPPLPAGPYLVVGLARSGVAALLTLRALGERAVGVDAGHPPVDLPDVHLGSDGLDLLDAAGAVVKSPGVPAEVPVIAAARERGLTVLGELELAWRLLPNAFIAVTGTNGKTTTAELIGHVHREAGVPVVVAGNVGTALTSLVAAVDPAAVIVCEASSFQLEDTLEFAPDAAVLLNVEPDHLDRHGTFERYRAAKLEAFARQGAEHLAVSAHDVPGRARRVEPLDVSGWELGVRGAHNAVNAGFAAAVCLERGIPEDAVRAGLRTFRGVEHRLEEVVTRDGVLYVNDSKATNVASTLVALAAFTAPVHLIVGGQGKGQDFAPLRAAAAGASVYLIGEDGRAIGAAIGAGTWCEDLEGAVAAARAAARPGDVVLLSPACASFDQHVDYEARGRCFKELVA